MSQKEVIIVVPGAKYIQSKILFFQKFVLFFYRLVNIKNPVYKNYIKDWEPYLKKDDRKIVLLDWDQGLAPWSLWLAKVMLKMQIFKHLEEGYTVNLMGFSLGGEIVINTINEYKDKEINKVVLICSVNTDNTMDKTVTKFLNIYSPHDLLATIAIKVFAPVHGGSVMQGDSVKNISVDKFGHDNFCINDVIENGAYKGKRITDLINEFLDK